MLVSSRAASISFRIMKGTGLLLWMARNKAGAATVLSSTDKLYIDQKRLPGATEL